MLFTIGIPVTKTNYLDKTLECISNQTFNDFELIIRNNGQTQEIKDEIKPLAKDEKTLASMIKQDMLGTQIIKAHGETHQATISGGVTGYYVPETLYHMIAELPEEDTQEAMDAFWACLTTQVKLVEQHLGEFLTLKQLKTAKKMAETSPRLLIRSL